MSTQATLTISHTLESILLRLSEHGPVEAKKLLSSQWGFLAAGEYSTAVEVIEVIEAIDAIEVIEAIDAQS